jgi:hypothetical protein
MTTADAILRTLESEDVPSRSLNAANVVDVLAELSMAASRIANAICPFQSSTGTDRTGGAVGCLTEAAMGITAGLVQIAEAHTDVAEQIRLNHSEIAPCLNLIAVAIKELAEAIRDHD